MKTFTNFKSYEEKKEVLSSLREILDLPGDGSYTCTLYKDGAGNYFLHQAGDCFSPAARGLPDGSRTGGDHLRFVPSCDLLLVLQYYFPSWIEIPEELANDIPTEDRP